MRTVNIAGMDGDDGDVSPTSRSISVRMEPGALGLPAAGAAAAEVEEDTTRELTLGDLVYLVANNQTNEGQDEDGFVHAEGYCDPRVGLKWVEEGGEPLELRECLFRLCPRLSYKASKSAEKFQRQSSLGPEAMAAQMNYLKEKKDKEESQNASVLSQLHEITTPLNYGQACQLQHVKSGKFLTMIPRALADVEKECLKLALVEQGNEGSWFKFRPRFKNRVDGRPIISSDQITLVNLKADIPLHSVRNALFLDDPYERSELSLSPAFTGFRCVCYHALHQDDAKWLRAGQGVRLHHPESESMLTGSANLFKSKAPYLFRKKKEEDDDIDDDVNLTTKSLFYVERPVRRVGGFVQWEDLVRLRHAATGRYLMVDGAALSGEEDDLLRSKTDTGPNFRALLEDPADDDDERVLFRFAAVAGGLDVGEEEAKGIPLEGLSVFLQHPLPADDVVVEETGEGTQIFSSCWLHNAHVTKSLDDSDLRANLRVGFCGNRLDEDSLTVMPAKPEELLELEKIVSGLSYAKSYVSLLKSHPNSEAHPIRSKDLREMRKMLSTVIFMTVDDDEMEAADKPMEAEGLPIEGPQQKMRELKMLDALFAMLRAPLEAGVTLQELRNEPRWHLVKEVHKLVFKAITHVFDNNSRNELYVTSVTYDQWMLANVEHTYMSEITRQLGYDLGAADCLKALISFNVKLLEEKIDFNTTSIFVELIRKKGPVDEFAKFLAALCSCQGKTFYKNQELLLEVVYSAGDNELYSDNRRQMLLETCVHTAGPRTPWRRADYSHRPTDPFMASDVYDNGVHEIYVSWSCSPSWTDEEVEASFYLPPDAMDLEVNAEVQSPAELLEYTESRSSDQAARQWVKLEDLAWVLDPSVYYEKVQSAKSWLAFKSEMNDDDALFARFELKRELAEYYVAQIHMLAATCSGRTYNAIRCLERQFSFELLVTVVASDKIPEELRTAFATMLMHLYVDRFPHEALKLPSLVRVHSELRAFRITDHDALPQFHIAEDSPLIDDHAAEFLRYRTATKFFLLQDVIQSRLELCGGTQIIEQVEENKLTLVQLQMLLKLMQFGFYSTIEALKALVEPVVQLLDGRGDVMTMEEVDDDLAVRRQSHGARPKGIMNLGGFLGGGGSGSEGSGRARSNTQHEIEQAALGIVTAEAASVDPSTVGSALLGDAEDGVKRYDNDPEQLVVAQAKRVLAAVMGVVADMRDDFRLRNMLLAIKEHPAQMTQLLPGGNVPKAVTLNGESIKVVLTQFEREEEEEKEVQPWLTETGIRTFNSLFAGRDQTPDAKQLELSTLTALPFHTTCLDLMMYEDPELFEAALRALVRHCSQRQSLLDNICDVQLLVTEESVHAQRVLERELGVLKNRLDDFETWGSTNQFGHFDAGVARAVNEAISRFAELCVVPRDKADLVPGEPPYVPNTSNQDLLRNMGVHEVIMKAYELPISAEDLANRTGTVFGLRKLCNDLLGKFVLGNTENQDLMFEYLSDVFMGQIGSGTGIAALIANIFRNNRNLCVQVPEEIVWQFANEIERKGCFERFLTFFFCVVEPEGSPLKRNQELIISIFTDEQFKNILKCFNDGVDQEAHSVAGARQSAGFQERKRLMALAATPNAGTPPDAAITHAKEAMGYHTKLVNLLSTVARGKSTMCEIKCQTLLPAHHCLAVLLDPETTLPVRSAFMAFMAEVYFETDIAEFEYLAADEGVWQLLDGISRDLRRALHHLADKTVEEKDFIFQRQFVCVEHFFAGTYSVDLLSEMDDPEMAARVVRELKDVVENFLAIEEGLSKLQSSSVASAAAALGVSAEVEEHNATRASFMEMKHLAELKRIRDLYDVSGPIDALQAFVGAATHDKRMRTFAIEDFDQLAQFITQVESLTAKDDEDFQTKVQHRDPLALADERANTITFESLVKRICRHVTDDHDDNVPLIATAVHVLAHIIDFKQPRDRERNQDTYMLEDVDLDFYAPLERAEDYENFVKIQEEMDSYGCTRLVVDLISDPALHDKLAIQALKLAIELLEGGNAKVQETIYDYCLYLGDDCDKFFIALQKRIQRAIADIQSRRRRKKFQDRKSDEEAAASAGAEEEEEEDLIGVNLVFRMLQLFAEGHNVQMQDLMRDQGVVGVRNSTNLIEETISFLAVLAKNEKQVRKMTGEDSQDLVALLEFLTEVVQGPCEANQVLLANSILVDTCSSIMWITFEIGSVINALEVRNLKGAAVRAVLSLLEGRADVSVHTVLAQKLEPKLIRGRMVAIYEEYKAEKLLDHDSDDWDEELLEEGFDLHKLVMTLTSADAIEQAVACRYFHEVMTATIKPSTFKDQKKLRVAVEQERRYQEAKAFFASRMKSVEVCWGSPPHLERIYFPLSSECEYFPEHAKLFVKNAADYGADDQTSVLMTHRDKLIDEMQHLENCSRSWVYRKIGMQLARFKTCSFLLAVLMNVLIVLSLEAGADDDDDPVYNPEEMEWVMFACGVPQVVLSVIVLLFLSWNRFPLIWNEHDRVRKAAQGDLMDMMDFELDLDIVKMVEETRKAAIDAVMVFMPTIRVFLVIVICTLVLYIRVDDLPTFWYVMCFFFLVGSGASALRRYFDLPNPPFKKFVALLGMPYKVFYDFLTNGDTLFYVIYVACALLGLLYRPYFYCFHLLDIIVMSDSLKNVVRAVTQPGKALSLTALLGLITIYMFSLVAFWFMRWSMYNADLGQNECSTMVKCFATFVHNGLMYGGGIGDYMGGELGNTATLNDDNIFLSRIVYDLLYFVVVVILLLNIIFGIIIDTFSSLRESDAEKEDLQVNYCFICSVPKDSFDNLGRDVFKKHIKEEHHMWDYLFYQAYLMHKDETDYTGAESAIWAMIQAQDVSWFPHGDALVLQQAKASA